MGILSHREIRRAREDDLDWLIDLGRRSWLSAFALTAPFALIQWWAQGDRVGSLYRQHWADMLVLDDDGVVVGLVQPKDAEINGLWVHPAHQGDGAGTLLLMAGEQIIRDAGHRTAWLTCAGFNKKAYAFYQSRGYVETARETEPHPCGIEVENIRMERTL